jgi:long-chain acyl-CoA synthetase
VPAGQRRTDTIVGAVQLWAERAPSARALSQGDRTVTFAELDGRADRVARALLVGGAADGARIAYLGRNAPEYFEVLQGATKAGCVTVPLNWRLAAPELEAILTDSGAVLLVVEREFADVVPDASRPPTVVVADGRGPEPTSTDYEQWLAAAPEGQPQASPRENAVVLQMYTSGTTGKPKGVMLTDSALAASSSLLADVTGMGSDSVTLCTMPSFHIGGTSWTLAALSRGSETVLINDLEVSGILTEIERRSVTIMIAVPTIIQRLVDSSDVADFDLSSLETVYYGGGPMTAPVIQRALRTLSCRFIQGFGLTELPLATVLPHEAHLGDPELLRSCGRAAPGTEIRLVDPDTGRDAETGGVGEIWVRSPRLMAGYWRQPEVTDSVLDEAGWFRTGDSAKRDENGYFYIQGRTKDMIVSGGENIYPGEVENVLMAHPAVSDCAVIGVPSERWAEAVMAVVVLTAGTSVDAADLIAFCRARLAGYKCPKTVAFVTDLPRTAAGKVLKFRLRNEFGRPASH